MSTAQARIKAAGELSILANKQFTSENRELFASFDYDALWRAMGAYIHLHERTAIAEAEPSVEAYIAIQRRAFLTLFERQAITPVAPITTLGQQALAQMRRDTGIGVAELPAPVVQKTPEEQYEESVIHLWETMPSEHFRARLNADKKMRDTFKTLSETNRIVARGASKSEPSAAKALAADQRFVKIDPTRFITSMDHQGQINVSEDRSRALVFSLQDAQQLVTKLRKNRFPQATVSE